MRSFRYIIDWPLLLGVALGILFIYHVLPPVKETVRFDELALGEENTTTLGHVDGIKVHCHDLDDLEGCLSGYVRHGEDSAVMLWLGNSQLHAINQYSIGDETAASGLHRRLQKNGIYFLTLSQPNANLQEHYLLFSHLLNRLFIKALVLPVVFDDMREDGIRTSLVAALRDHKTTQILRRRPIGRSLIANHSDQDAAGNDMAALEDTVQERSEKLLNSELEEVWLIWSERPFLRGSFFDSLYLLRNWVFAIDPSTTRKMIPGRYVKNRDAFSEILDLASRRGVKVLVYVVPLRNDVKVPYDTDEYEVFKSEISSIANKRGARFLNLEDLVPGKFWGTKGATSIGGGQELDFMHFQDGGHRLLENRLYNELSTLSGIEIDQ